MKYKALLWDNDGTIADTTEWILASFNHCMKEVMGLDSPNDSLFRATMGQTLHDQLTNYTKDEALIEKLIASYRAHNETVIQDLIKTFEGLPDVLKLLKDAGYFMGIVTSKVHSMTLRGLEVLGLDDIFDYIQGCDDCPYFKPDPAVLTHACKTLCYEPSDVLYIGDTVFDMMAASGAGCDTCGVLWGVTPKPKLIEKSPTYIVEKPKDLLDILL